ncbi:hypothetical protein IWQ61_004405, partial [Dispira simplex]
MDITSFKAQVIQDTTVEERVQVNQRHLIDKILARYSAPFTIYRELLQNANDAGATEARVIFRSEQSVSGQEAATKQADSPASFDPQAVCHTILFQNNGRPFQSEDWNRLRKIAEGNPDEQKIGFFGVGFYSLFSICEEPFVVSDKDCMAFFWKQDQLFTKKAVLPEEQQRQYTPWTTFLLGLRDALTLPDVEEFGRFLACSIAFTRDLRSVSMYLDDQLLVKVSKKASDLTPLTCTEPNGRQLTEAAQRAFRTHSPHGMFRLRAVHNLQVQIDAEYLKMTKSSGMFWKKSAKFTRTSSTLFFRIAQARLTADVPTAFAKQMERATKKHPPAETTVQLIYTGLEEYEASICIHQDFPLFRDLFPFPNQGRTFIGFPTHQTTGCSIHVAAHVIPTVERETMDFVDPSLARWNQEIITMCALVVRILYNEEMHDIGQRFNRLRQNAPKTTTAGKPGSLEPDPALDWLERRCIHALRSFNFENVTTPLSIVGKIMEEGFFAGAVEPPTLLSVQGVRPCSRVRLPDPELLPFLRTTPYLSAAIQDAAPGLLNRMSKRFPLQKVNIDDVIRDVADYAVTIPELTALLRWWLKYSQSASRQRDDQWKEQGHRLRQGITLLTPVHLENPPLDALPADAVKDQSSGTLLTVSVTLSDFHYFVNPKTIHPGLPLPSDVLPLDLTRHFTQHELVNSFKTWSELPVVTWVQFLVKEHRKHLETLDEFAEKILTMLSRTFYQQDASNRATILSLLDQIQCMPTQLGHRRPSDTYFRNVKLFADLPIVQFQKWTGALDRFLGDLGVRTHVNLQLVFDRLENLNWDFVQLVKYLTSVRTRLSAAEMDKLRQTAFFPARVVSVVPDTPMVKLPAPPSGKSGPPAIEAPSKGPEPPQPSIVRYCAADLYAPTEILQSLGLPVLDWPGRWRASSEESHFLLDLGLRTFPPLQDLIQLIADAPSTGFRASAIHYFVNQFDVHYRAQYRPHQVTRAFLPCSRWQRRTQGNPGEGQVPTVDTCFTRHELLARPTECFAAPEAKAMELPLLDSEWQTEASKFGVPLHPRVAVLLQVLEKRPFSDVTQARLVFEYLTSRQVDFRLEDWKKLRGMRFIPTPGHGSPTEGNPTVDKGAQLVSTPAITFRAPVECYFANQGVGFQYDFFTYIDFGPVANLFLKSCGVQDEPSPVDLVHSITKDPEQFLESCRRRNHGTGAGVPSTGKSDTGYQQYLVVLRQLAVQMPLLSRYPDVMQRMRNRPFLIAVRDKPLDTSENPTTKDNAALENTMLEYRLEYPYNISLVDDTVLQKLFTPWTSPMETILETFYEQLGSPWLTKQVSETTQVSGTLSDSPTARALKKLIEERAPLLIYEYQREHSTKVQVTSEWLATKLIVCEVDRIHIYRKFAPTQQVHVETITASLERGQRITGGVKGARYLLITRNNYNKFDVATCLCKLLFGRCRLNDALLLETLLSTSLAHLKRKGFPVERVLNYSKPVAPAAPPPSSTTTRSDSQGSPALASAAKPSPTTTLPSIPPALQPHLRQLQSMFPDCDPAYLQRCLLAEKHDHVAQVSNKLLDQGYPRRAREETPTTAEHRTKDSTPNSTPITSGQRKHPPKPTKPENQIPSSDSLGTNPAGLFNRFTRQLQTSINDLYKGYDKLIPPAQGGSSTSQNPVGRTEVSSSSRNGSSPSSSGDNTTGTDVIPGGFPTTSNPPTQSNGSWKPTNTLPLDYTERVNRSLMSSINSCVRNAAPFHGTQATQPTIPPPPKDYTEQPHDDYC